MKKFYKLVSAAAENGAFKIELDGRPVKTPSGAVLAVPSQPLADAIVSEWAGQKETIVPDTMPLTQILTTAQDRVAVDRAAMMPPLLAYLNTDLICYRTELPEDLAARQAELWDPWIDWFEGKCGARLLTTTALAALSQPEQAHEAAKQTVAAMNDHEFTVLQLVTPLAGSLVLALAFTAGDASPDEVYRAAYAEEDYKAEIYNEAEHGAAPLEEKKRASMRRDLEAARIFLNHLKI